MSKLKIGLKKQTAAFLCYLKPKKKNDLGITV